MRFKCFLLLTSFFIVNLSSAFAQRDTLSGLWEGILTVENDEKILSRYHIFFSFSEENGSITGASTIVYQEFSAKLSFSATLKNKETLEIKELEIVKADTLPSGEWCVKNITMKRFFEKNKVIWRGEWKGKTSFSDCLPGKIYLIRAAQRA